jgi:hypothetical protein
VLEEHVCLGFRVGLELESGLGLGCFEEHCLCVN